MSRVLVVCPDHIKRNMSGPAIRYFELSHQLHRSGHEVILGTPATPDIDPQPFEIVRNQAEVLGPLAPDQDVILIQGWALEFFPFLRNPNACLVADLYCPFYLELLVDWDHNPDPEQLPIPIDQLRVTLDPIRQADFFICASEKQRDYWLGVLTALNRVNPETYRADHSLRALIDVVPYGLADQPPLKSGPVMRGVIPGIGRDDYVVFWGSSIYNWFDPLTLIHAINRVRSRVPNIRMVVLGTSHPNPDLVTQTWMLSEARRLSLELGLTGKHVFFNEGWVPYDQRANWFLEADIGVSFHLQNIEGHFSFRTRFLDYLWTGLPILCSSGDILAEAVEANQLGMTVAPGDVHGLALALERLAEPSTRHKYRSNIAAYAPQLTWTRVAAPLIRFCDDPRPAPDLARVAPARTMPIPLRDHGTNGSGTDADKPRDWRYYAVKAASSLVYEGPLAVARRGSQFVAQKLVRPG